jgi:predicted ATP-dependent endonuclease of OLD family
MFLKRLKINNFRKFRTTDNVIEFVDAESYRNHLNGVNVNIAPITTLLVGKNNSGKTTIVTSLIKLIKDHKFTASDFNFSYLKGKLLEYQKDCSDSDFELNPPILEFKLTIGIEDNSKDIITNLVPFMTLKDVNNSELEIIVKFEPKEVQLFKQGVIDLLDKGITDFGIRFKKFTEIINGHADYSVKYYSGGGTVVNQFKISDLVEIKAIKANNIDNEKSLSKAFSKIVEYRYNSILSKGDRDKLEGQIEEVNYQLSSSIAKQHTRNINKSLSSIESSDKLKMLLSSDLTFKKLITGIVKYEYVEQEFSIPENQFGLGYTNLMMIISDLIGYIEKYPDQAFNSKVNLISIEEPETFMHPQMQELFIKHINEAISSLLVNSKKNINSQLIITTHSSHILNSKIHSGNSFNNINYITTISSSSHVVALNDFKITPDDLEIDKEKSLKFLKKHIKYKVSELFFSDAVIFVEGVTEETLLRFYVENNNELHKHYISIFNINGAHGLVYHKLIKLLRIPCLVITDLDIKRNKDEKSDFTQITNLKSKITTNSTIKKYNANSDSLEDLPTNLGSDNILVSYQGNINGYYATSFEEAFILTNFEHN